LKVKLRMYLEKINVDLEEEKDRRCNWDAENDIRMNFRRR